VNALKILSCGAGMQSTALALMSCENKSKGIIHQLVPIYDAIIFCDLGKEPHWVYYQVKFIMNACDQVGIPFYILDTHLYDDYVNNFGKSRVVSIPFWTVDEEGKKGKMMRNCTLDYKINAIQKFVRHELMGYKKYERTRSEDIKSHEMHIGFSMEENSRCSDNPHKMFINKFPLIELGYERKDNYAYIKDVWGLETKASACNICPFHRNYFFKHLRQNHPQEYLDVLKLDQILEDRQPDTKIRSKLYISRSRKRIKDLLDEECNDKEMFPYQDQMIWNGF
jgi:hypothetical protein